MHKPGRLRTTLLDQGNRWAWSRLVPKVMRRDGYRCQLCGEPAQEIDHRLPRALGGTDDPSNLRAICKSCHKMRNLGLSDAEITRGSGGRPPSRYSYGGKR